MAIIWDTSACSMPLPLDKEEAEQREALIFLGAELAAGNLTADTLREWMVRALFLEWAHHRSPLFGSPLGLREVLHRWIGLAVNVREVSRTAWMAEKTEALGERLEYIADKAIEEASVFSPLGATGKI